MFPLQFVENISSSLKDSRQLILYFYFKSSGKSSFLQVSSENSERFPLNFHIIRFFLFLLHLIMTCFCIFLLHFRNPCRVPSGRNLNPKFSKLNDSEKLCFLAFDTTSSSLQVSRLDSMTHFDFLN